MKRQNLLLIFVSGLLVMFSYTLVNKMGNPDYLAYSIGNYPVYKYLLSHFMAPEPVAYSVILLEFFLILSFFLFQMRHSMIFCSALLGFYVLNLVSLTIENEVFDCGCGLFYKSLNPKYMIFFDLLLISALFQFLVKVNSDKTYYLKGIAKLYSDKLARS